MSRPEPSTNLLRLAAPIVLSFWMRAGFSLVDTVFAATLGDAAIAAIGLTVPLEFLMIASWVGVSTGLTAQLSRAMGAGESERIAQFIALTRRIVFVLCGLFLVVGGATWFISPHLGLDAETTRYFQIYATVLMAGSGVTSFWSLIPDSLIKAHHDTRSTMMAGIWSNVINVTLNTLFLFVFGWGILGIALSTVLGRIGGLVYAVRKARAHERARLAEATDVRPGTDARPLRTLLALAVPAAMSYGLMSTEGLVINALLARTAEATAAIAAYSVFHRAFLFLVMPVIAITIAMLPFVGRLLGAGRLDLVKRGFRQAMGASGVYIVLVVAPVCWFGAEPVALKLAEAPRTVSLTIAALRLCPLICLGAIPFILCRPMFEGLGRGKPVLVFALLRYVVLTLPLILVGMAIAPRWGQPPLVGLLLGMLTGTAIVSAVMWATMLRALDAAAATPR